jgi:hypothetical protein
LRVSRAQRRTRRRIFFGVVALVVVLGAGGAVLALVTNQPPQHFVSGCTFATGTTTTSGTPTYYALTPDQAQNASIIAAVAIQKGLPDHAVTVALATAFQESQLENLTYGDLDSVGLFQQRPSQGWGTPAQIENPVYAATAFYDHLLLVQGWETMPVTQAAQLVQVSASPDAYAQWAPEARSLALALTGEVPAGLTCHLDGFGGAAPTSSTFDTAATTEIGTPGFGVPVSAKRGWQVAAWAVAHAYNYHLTSVTFDGRLWTPSSGSWSGAPTSRSAVVVTP